MPKLQYLKVYHNIGAKKMKNVSQKESHWSPADWDKGLTTQGVVCLTARV